nr:MAG: RNA-dependent RNA polymerase [Leptosphaeria biglobosa negative single-stranded RNA virus 3]
MHDVLCLGIVSAGLYKEEDLTLSKLGISTNDKRLNQQHPDLFSVELFDLQVADVLLSYNVEVEKAAKQVKYNDFFALVHEKTGLSTNYVVFAVDLTDPEWEDSLPTLPSVHSELLNHFIENLRNIHSVSEFAGYRSSTSQYYALDKFRFEISESTMDKFAGLAGTTSEEVDVMDKLDLPEFGPNEQKEYIRQMSRSILASRPMKRPHPRPEATEPVELIKAFEDYKLMKKNTDKLPRILQLGAPAEFSEEMKSYEDFLRSLRQTRHHGGYLDYIRSFLASSDPTDGRIITLSLSDSQLKKEQLEGPGRKAALKKYGLQVEREAPRHIGVDPSHIAELDGLIQQVEDGVLRTNHAQVRYPDLETTGFALQNEMEKIIDSHNSCPMSTIAKFYQLIAQEIVINSMRRRKNRQYVLCQTGVTGIFFIVAPGPQLRTESNTEFVKIISFVRPIVNELSAPWRPTGDHWESDWLSVDTDRLKHWSRCYDRTLVSSVACAERLVEPGLTLSAACVDEIKRGNYQLLVLTYIEDKQLTSITNQTIRYLWIKALGDKQLGSIMSKFPTRIASVIQSTMIQRSVSATVEICRRPLSDFIKMGKSTRDEHTGAYDETTTGVIGKLPRLFTTGPPVPIGYNLNEIYWCMLYNKDRQNPTQDALSILNKILKEEMKYNTEISLRETSEEKLNYITGNESFEKDVEHIRSSHPESHYYSRKAVLTGMSLQDKHQDNMAPNRSWLTPDRLNTILSKNISEFATFKASVKSLAAHVDVTDIRSAEQVGSRTKAIELVAEIATNERLSQAFEIAMSFSGDHNDLFEIMIQIFKKGQIGGIREIMILYIKARILFNITEEICRLLSKSDKREILTKGRDKRLMMRGDYEEVLAQFPRGTPVQMVKNSYDMTSWAQKFIPTIFTCIFRDSLESYQNVKNLSYFVFLKHTMKRIEHPRKLVEAWQKHPEIEHQEPWLQKAKKEFLTTGVPWFHNRSNMCQGIPHYASTVLAVSCQSLRDALFLECLDQLNQICRLKWKTRVGSDDKGDMIGIDMSYPESYSQYILFEQCAMAAERLHSMELSVKSAAGNVIYELNSAYMANLETLSPTIKFAAASCDLIATSSCAVFVNESYGRIRQLRENGASSLLCGIAHIMNGDFFNRMFRTGPGMTNDVCSIFGVPRSLIPYDFGVYPFFDVDLQEIVGPEYHNYSCMKSPKCPEALKSLLFTPLSKEDVTEAFPDDQEALLKKDHFGIRQGLINQLVAMRRRVGVEAKTVEEFFGENPFLLVRGPETVEETIKVIHSKLLTKGASEALRRTSPAIYLARLSAFETAKAWTMRKPTGTHMVDLDLGVKSEVEEEVQVTYREFIEWGLQRASATPFPVKEMMHVLYPQASSYEVIKQFVGQFGLKRESSKKHSQAVRTWMTNSYNYNFTSSLKAILETSFGISQLSAQEDVKEFKKMIGMNMDSFEGFVQECTAKGIRPMDMFFYMSKIYKSSKASRVQAFANGPSTGSLHGTLISIKRFSHLPNTEMVMDLGMDPSETQAENRIDLRLEGLKYCCNLLLMQAQGSCSSTGNLLETCTIGSETMKEWCETSLRSIKSIQGMDHHTKKILTFVATQVFDNKELKEKLVSWKSLNYSYLRKQRKVTLAGQTTWSGNLEVLVNSGNNTYTLKITGERHHLQARRIDDPQTLLNSLIELCRILSLDHRKFFIKRRLTPGSYYLSTNSKSLLACSTTGPVEVCLDINLTRNYRHMRLADFDTFSVQTSHDRKSGAVSVRLVQRSQSSATICHFPGSYYPCSKPRGLRVDSDAWYKGVRLHSLLQNEEWFHNYRLPALSDNETTKFFRNDVNFEVILSLDDSNKARIVEYLQVMDELNEELFTDVTQPTGYAVGSYNQTYNFDELEPFTINEIFAKAMDEIEMMQTYQVEKLQEGNLDSWADQAEEELEEGLDNLENALGTEEDQIKFVRSMGYVRPKRKANFQVISQLQHGYMLKDRVLNMFFKNNSITAEERRVLPHYFIWLRDNPQMLPKGLAESLSKMIIQELQLVMGATKQELLATLDFATSSLGQPPRKVINYISGEEEDLFTKLGKSVMYSHTRYDEESLVSE